MRGRFRQHAFHEEARGDELGGKARIGAVAELGVGGVRDPAPHVAERDQTEHVHVVGGAGAGIVGLGHGVLHEPHRGLLQVASGDAERRHQRLHLVIGRLLFDVAADFAEERHQRAAAVLAELAADKIERLDAVGAFVDLRNARVAHELLHAVLGDVAVAAEHLLRHHGVGKTGVGAHAFDHRRQQAHEIVGALAFFLVLRAMGDVALERGPQHQRARRFVEGADRHQRAAHIRMHDDRIGGLVGKLGAGDGAALQAFLGVDRGVLIGDFGLRQTLNTNTKSCFIHHREHRRQAAIFLADQPANGAVVIHHAGRIAVNAHLLFDGAAGHAVARAQ